MGEVAVSCHHRPGSWGPLSLSVGIHRPCDLEHIIPRSGPRCNMRGLFSSKFYNLRCLHGEIMEPKLLLSSFPGCFLEVKVCFSASVNWKALMYAMEGAKRNSRAITP